MCNLSEGIWEEGINQGVSQIVLRMHSKGYSAEQISDVTDVELSEVEKILQK